MTCENGLEHEGCMLVPRMTLSGTPRCCQLFFQGCAAFANLRCRAEALQLQHMGVASIYKNAVSLLAWSEVATFMVRSDPCGQTAARWRELQETKPTVARRASWCFPWPAPVSVRSHAARRSPAGLETAACLALASLASCIRAEARSAPISTWRSTWNACHRRRSKNATASTATREP